MPLRSPGMGKTRLGTELNVQERAALSLAMLADVTAALRSVPLDRVVVAASGPQAATSVAAFGLEAIVDPPGNGGLDTAVDTACRHFGPEVSLLVVAADLPRLRPDDVAAVIERPEPVVVAPTWDGGTATLLRRPPLAVPSAFGAGSAARHLHLAAARALETATIDRAAFRHDVDTWSDLRALSQGHVGAATAGFLQCIGPRLETAR
ncbi:MAG: 2-phospho-L-lactate guanylyltransferase [Nitriliruptorales bacterium]